MTAQRIAMLALLLLTTFSSRTLGWTVYQDPTTGSTTFGTCNQDMVLFDRVMREPVPAKFERVSKTVGFELPQWCLECQSSCVRVVNLDPTYRVWPYRQQGGPGLRNVELRVFSEMGVGLLFRLQVFGKGPDAPAVPALLVGPAPPAASATPTAAASPEDDDDDDVGKKESI